MADTWPTKAEPERVLVVVRTAMWESETDGRPAAWLRAWPSGHVHYSHDWCARLDGRFDTACGKAPNFWPQCDWPEAKVCPACAEAFTKASSPCA